MVIAVEEIVDRDSLEAWLNERPEDLRRQCAVFLASRAAARVAPLAWNRLRFAPFAKTFNLTSLPVCRSLVISEVAFLAPTTDIKLASVAAMAAVHVFRAANTDAALTGNSSAALGADVAANAAVAAATPARRALAAAARAVARATEADFYVNVHSDCQLWLDLEASGDIDIARLQSAPLWPDENPFAKRWADLKAKLIADATSDDPRSADWSFWIDWYDGLLEGRAQNIDMLLEIVSTDKIDWEAPPREVNEVIAGIVERYRTQTKINQTKITQSQIQRTKSAIQENRNALPPTLECIEFLIANEIQRLQQKNYADVIEMEESKRLISVFMQLLSATRTLSSKVVIDEIGDDEATEVISTLGVYKKLMADWPRDNAPEVVDGVYGIGLVGSVTGVFVMCGLPAPVGAAVAGAAFGGKKLAKIAKALIKGSGT